MTGKILPSGRMDIDRVFFNIQEQILSNRISQIDKQ